MHWHILLADSNGQKFTSLPLPDREEAIDFARALISAGDLRVLKIAPDKGDEVDIDAVGLRTRRIERVRLTRADVARFCVDQLKSEQYVSRAETIANL